MQKISWKERLRKEVAPPFGFVISRNDMKLQNQIILEDYIMKKEITYTKINGINYPNLALPEQPKVKIVKYGQMRLDFLKKYRRGTYTTLLTEGRLAAHLSDIDQEARLQVEYLTTKLSKKRSIDENFKANNPLLWVREMNNCKAFAEEVVLREVVYQ